MVNFYEYGDVKLSTNLKNADRKLRFFSKESINPGQYVLVNHLSKVTAYVTVMCHPLYFRQTEYRGKY